MSGRIYLSKPHVSGDENDLLKKAIETNWITTYGYYIDKFESCIENYIRSDKYAVALNSGTSALHLALILLGVTEGDEVICQTSSFVASANPILYQKARPVFVDSEKDTWNMCPDFLEEAIRDRIRSNKKPKAIIVVNSYGMPAKWTELKNISYKYNIPIIEDAAESLGAMYKGEKCGTLGNLGVYSFNGNKIITTSSGGMLICNSKEEQKKALFYASQAKDFNNEGKHLELGYNYRMSNILAALGVSQFNVLEKRIRQRRRNNLYYQQNLNTNTFKLQQESSDDFFSNFWLSCGMITSKSYKRIKLNVKATFQEENIEYRNLWYPLHKQPLFSSSLFYGDGLAEDIYERGFCLPSSSSLTDSELDRISSILNKTLVELN